VLACDLAVARGRLLEVAKPLAVERRGHREVAERRGDEVHAVEDDDDTAAVALGRVGKHDDEGHAQAGQRL
jgi:hypothetical protein